MIRKSPTGRHYRADGELSAMLLWRSQNLSTSRGDSVVVVTDFTALEQRVLAKHLTAFICLETLFPGPVPTRQPSANPLFAAPYGVSPLTETIARCTH